MLTPTILDRVRRARPILLARRLVERGVKFVQIVDLGWDHHSGIARGLPNQCRQIDQPSPALVADLKQRGLLDDTLVTWGGELAAPPTRRATWKVPTRAATTTAATSPCGSPAAG